MHTARLRSRIAARLRIATGWQRILESRATGAAILCYHGIAERCCDPNLEGHFVDVPTLREHLAFLRRRYEVVPLAQIVAALADGSAIPPRWVALTFDDALENQLTLGAEILADSKVPWSLAVPAGLIGTSGSIWTYELALLVLRYWERASIPDPLDPSQSLATELDQQRESALSRIRAAAFEPHAADLGWR